MSEVISAEQLHTDTLKFVLKVANLVTVQEYAEELVEEQGLDRTMQSNGLIKARWP